MGLTESGPKPERLGSKIDYKIIAIIFFLTVAYYVISNSIDAITDEFNVIDVTELSLQAAAMVTAFYISKLYWPGKIFGKAYFALGISFGMWFVAEVIWQAYENIFFISPYPSIADIFYFAFYPFALYHMITNIRGFEVKIFKKSNIWMAAIPVIILSGYSYLAITEWGGTNFDYYYSLIFVTIASVSTSFAILGALTFRRSAFAVVWSLLAVGLFLHIAGDIWYYYLEIFSAYTNTHVVNALWQAGWMLIIYSLYKHQKIL
ncbi:MAG: hypothetical protein HZC29_08880 [Thaumarchaeota archaeon]|nr:hypothetical protein [Nitrososphaerota archaeon]